MTQTTAPPEHAATPPPGDREGPAVGRWRLLLKRLLVVSLSALLTLALLVLLLAWLALRIEWRVPDPTAMTGPSVLYASDGTELARFDSDVDRRVVPLTAVSDAARDAVIAAEDVRFYEHEGVDPLSLLRAIVVNVRTGSITQGGSTLTQQYVKNAYVGSDRSFQRKIHEAVVSISLERELSKDEILEHYLNQVYFGEGAYGIEAAALTYFGVPASQLSVAQGATLAQLLPAPSTWNPRVDPTGAVQRRDRVIERMVAAGFVAPAEGRDARSEELEVQPRQRREHRVPYFVEYVRKQLVAAFGEQAVTTGALQVTTTIDLDAQEALEQAVADRLPHDDARPEVDAGAVAIDPATGAILALYGGRDFTASAFDLATQARRRPGSTFKPFAYIAALEAGIRESDVYAAPARFARGELCDPGWGPANAGGGGFGRMTLRQGLVNSVNTVFAQIGCEVGPEPIAEVAGRFGVRSELQLTPQIAIGGLGTNSTALDLADAFATIANDGIDCPVHGIISVIDQHGETVSLRTGDRAPSADALVDRPEEWQDDDQAGCWRVADADVVRATTAALEEVVHRTTGTRARIDRPQAGKTGTTDDEVDAWFAGYTPDLAMVVRVGDREEVPLRDIGGFARVQGGTIPALIWRDAAERILADVAPRAFPEPGEDVDESVVAPARPRTDPRPPRTEPPATEPEPTPTPTDTGATPTEGPTDGGTEPGDDDDGGDDGGGSCIPLIQDCDDP